MNPSTKRIPVAEVFGPTVQGEGEMQGIPSYFIRFGGCDYRCTWCDTPFAVLPQAVRALERITTKEIIDKLFSLPRGPEWVILTGGNPVLHDLTELVNELHYFGYKVSVETQGTKYLPWVSLCDSICVSPKPPSSEMNLKVTEESLSAFLRRVSLGCTFLKVVVFDHADYSWAKKIHVDYPDVPFYLSAGNDAGKTVGNPTRVDERTSERVALDLLSKARWLTNQMMVDKAMQDVRVQAQYHCLIWGNERGH